MENSIQNKKPEIVYHYTTMSALYSIINGIKSNEDGSYFELYATYYRFANDPTEYFFANECIYEAIRTYEDQQGEDHEASNMYKKVFDGVGGFLQEPFIVSFSALEDDLSMWRMYGGNGLGIAIGVDANSLMTAFKDEIFYPCTYKDRISFIEELNSEKIAKIFYEFSKKIVEEGPIYDTNMLRRILKYRLFIKQSCYSPECEWRIALLRMMEDCGFREKNGMIIPYHSMKIPLDFLKKIYIGPCLDKDLHELSLRNFIAAKFPEGTEDYPQIISSNLPYVIR